MRSAILVGSLALAISIVGCGSNDPATSGGGSGGALGFGGVTPPITSTGGSSPSVTGAGGSASGAGGATTPATTGAGGSASGTGGTTTPAGTGGSAGSGDFSPLCANLTTAAGAAPTKSGLCTDTDPKLCYKTCGPESKGFKSETCTAGAYVEQSGCSFPSGDYACYKIPTAADATCPATAPQASTACTVAPCVVCGGTTGYLDSSGASKTGYCVCPTSASGTSKWSCASSTAWPCPAGSGC
jgi:hypothetical protein